jgi:hypothetical protein
MGYGSIASGFYSTALGVNTNAIGSYSIAAGYGTTAWGNYATAFGRGTNASGYASLTFGQTTKAVGAFSTAMGRETTAYGDWSTTMGHSINASGNYSVGIGLDSTPYTITQDNTMAIMGGNVGIGIADPIAPLMIVGDGDTIRINGDTSPGGIHIAPTPTANGWWIGTGSGVPSNFIIRDAVQSLDRVVIDVNGNVGIGTPTPQRTLHVNDTMRLEPRASAPLSPVEGDIYYDGILHSLMVYDGTIWQACF